MDEAYRFDMIDDEIHDINHESTGDRYYNFRSNFVLVYGLAMAAEWLQASYLYGCLRNTHKLSEPAVAYLFATGFVSAGIAALFVGSITDQYGRKFMCKSYCIIYSLSCVAMILGTVPLLFVGRVMGGVCTTLLYSSFETWMTAEYHRQGFGQRDTALSTIQSIMAIANGLVAVGSGIVAQAAVNMSGSHSAPFLLSIGCLSMALMIISRSWAENFGLRGKSSASDGTWKASVTFILRDPSMVILTLTMCFFEGSVYMMLYSWPQAIMSARAQARIWGNPQFGLNFANFTGAMALGSFLYSYMSRDGNPSQVSSRTVQLASSIAASALLLAIIFQDEMGRFWAICLFQLCAGMYYPSMTFLKDRLVQEERRARVYGLMKVPLNVFTVFCLTTEMRAARTGS
ncbi:major facilitator superfamily domain protein [Fusarium beomiforme]|uniref:Molybdate-anion transporter n=1 Tax=Fusarium beomiforme TaxID=44412 RepID=A0A9P5A7X1_9HYPO|nr:major facilitator superfamily domain protein [Fusarium beomiforme]